MKSYIKNKTSCSSWSFAHFFIFFLSSSIRSRNAYVFVLLFNKFLAYSRTDFNLRFASPFLNVSNFFIKSYFTFEQGQAKFNCFSDLLCNLYSILVFAAFYQESFLICLRLLLEFELFYTTNWEVFYRILFGHGNSIIMNILK